MRYRKGRILGLLLGVLLLFCSCYPAVNLPEENDYIGGIDPDDLPESSEEPVSQEEKPEAKYVDVDTLEKVRTNVDTKCVFDDRALILEDTPENELEYLTYMLRYYATLPDFEQYKAMHSSEMQIEAGNTEKAFVQGDYFTEYTFHGLEVLDEEVAAALCDGFVGQDMTRLAEKYHFTEYAVVETDFTMVRKNKDLDEQAQTPSGRYTYAYLWAKTADDESFKLYTVYWTY